MERSRIDSAALLAAAVAAVLILLVARSGFSYVTSIGGATLLFVLFSYDQEGKRSVFQSLAFSAVCGFCVMLACGIIFQAALGPKVDSLSAAAKDAYFQIRLSTTWGFATLVLWAIDCARMSGRAAYEPALHQQRESLNKEPESQAGRVRRQHQLIPEFTGAFPAVSTPPAAPAAPAPAIKPEYQEAPSARPPEPEPAPPPAAASPEPIPPPAAVSPAAIPLPPGKETMIYVNLVGEGLNVLRSVRAEHLGRDFYKIIEEMPAGETWEYSPGQVVRCKKQKLSSGKALVAVEEAPRSQ